MINHASFLFRSEMILNQEEKWGCLEPQPDNREFSPFKMVKPFIQTKPDAEIRQGSTRPGKLLCLKRDRTPSPLTSTPCPPSGDSSVTPGARTLLRDTLTGRNLTVTWNLPRAERCMAHPYFCLLRLEGKEFVGCSACEKAKQYVRSCAKQTSHCRWNNCGAATPPDRGKEARERRTSLTSEAVPGPEAERPGRPPRQSHGRGLWGGTVRPGVRWAALSLALQRPSGACSQGRDRHG